MCNYRKSTQTIVTSVAIAITAVAAATQPVQKFVTMCVAVLIFSPRKITLSRDKPSLSVVCIVNISPINAKCQQKYSYLS